MQYTCAMRQAAWPTQAKTARRGAARRGYASPEGPHRAVGVTTQVIVPAIAIVVAREERSSRSHVLVVGSDFFVWAGEQSGFSSDWNSSMSL